MTSVVRLHQFKNPAAMMVVAVIALVVVAGCT